MSLYSKVKDKQGRVLEAVWLMLKNPAMRPLVEQGQRHLAAFNEIDNFRDNWWCDADFDSRFLNDQGEEITNYPAPAFFTQSEITEAATEKYWSCRIDRRSDFFGDANGTMDKV